MDLEDVKVGVIVALTLVCVFVAVAWGLRLI